MPEDRLSRAVLRKRDEFIKAESMYKFFEEAYKGGRDYINSGHLYRHTFEDGEGFGERKRRAYYYNYCAPIVNAYNSFIYILYIHLVSFVVEVVFAFKTPPFRIRVKKIIYGSVKK